VTPARVAEARPRLSVIIVNFNAGDHLRDCLQAVRADLADEDWTAVVVDNASSDGSVDRVAAWSPRLTIIRNDVNRGFGAAVNQGARGHQSSLIWILNPDCRAEPGTFRALVRALDAHPDAAIAAPQLLNEDGTTQESARGEPSAATGLFGRHGLLTRFLPRSQAARRNLRAADLVASAAEPYPTIDWAMGASLLVRRELFDRVGGFDERFFLYWEDADLCRRLRDLGYTIRYVPAARVMHLGGHSSRTAKRLAVHAFHRSAYLYYATHVVRSPWHPARWFAKAALTMRAYWRGRN
jgi:N-acetylglucosaminyl-diphospho-decaprenol L-rhamnosyltransferase